MIAPVELVGLAAAAPRVAGVVGPDALQAARGAAGTPIATRLRADLGRRSGWGIMGMTLGTTDDDGRSGAEMTRTAAPRGGTAP